MIGCQNFDPSSLPLADPLGLMSMAPVPAEVASRYGPLAVDRIKEIKDQGMLAAKGTPAEREEIAQRLAEEIQQESNPVVRQEMIKSIAKCENSIAELVLRAGLNDNDADVQIESCRAWGNWHTSDSVPLLSQLLRNEAAALDVKLAAVTALADTENEQAVAALSVALEKDSDPALQHKAVLALQRLTDHRFGNDLVAWRNFVDHGDEDQTKADGGTKAVVKWPFSWWE